MILLILFCIFFISLKWNLHFFILNCIAFLQRRSYDDTDSKTTKRRVRLVMRPINFRFPHEWRRKLKNEMQALRRFGRYKSPSTRYPLVFFLCLSINLFLSYSRDMNLLLSRALHHFKFETAFTFSFERIHSKSGRLYVSSYRIVRQRDISLAR